MAKPLPGHQVPEKILNHFNAIQWVSAHIADPSFKIVSMSRTLHQPGSGHSLMASTWNTDGTIPKLLSIYRPRDKINSRPAEVRRFYTFGDGLNAHPNLLHGGVVATILDSTMGNAIAVSDIEDVGSPMFTVNLNVTYKKPVKTPGTIMARAWVTNVEGHGRKVRVHGVVESGSDTVHATAEGLWLGPKPKL